MNEKVKLMLSAISCEKELNAADRHIAEACAQKVASL